MKTLIIDRPGLQTARQRLLFGSMTIAFWALWIYLWLPILALIGWALGFKIAYYEMVVKNGYVGLLHLLGFYATIVLCLGAVFFGSALGSPKYGLAARLVRVLHERDGVRPPP